VRGERLREATILQHTRRELRPLLRRAPAAWHGERQEEAVRGERLREATILQHARRGARALLRTGASAPSTSSPA
jgi:hypothetical protein